MKVRREAWQEKVTRLIPQREAAGRPMILRPWALHSPTTTRGNGSVLCGGCAPCIAANDPENPPVYSQVLGNGGHETQFLQQHMFKEPFP